MQQPDLSRVAGVISDNIRGSCPMFVLTIVTRGTCHMSHARGGAARIHHEGAETLMCGRSPQRSSSSDTLAVNIRAR